MLSPMDAANIRAIFIHTGEPVPVDVAARLLGWDLETMDAAIKWRAVELDETAPCEPSIARRELIEHAFEQWPLATIKAALSRAEWSALVASWGAAFGHVAVYDADSVRSAAGRHAEHVAASAALLRPEAAKAMRRRAARERNANLVVPEQFKQRRRNDGVREFTLTSFEVRYRDLVPMLRLRGRWLARMGFKPGMRVYVAASPGALVITTADPANVQKQPAAHRSGLGVASTLAVAVSDSDGAGSVA